MINKSIPKEIFIDKMAKNNKMTCVANKNKSILCIIEQAYIKIKYVASNYKS